MTLSKQGLRGEKTFKYGLTKMEMKLEGAPLSRWLLLRSWEMPKQCVHCSLSTQTALCHILLWSSDGMIWGIRWFGQEKLRRGYI